jgi:hypothetical protein
MRKSAALILAGGLATAAVTAIPEAEARPWGWRGGWGGPGVGYYGGYRSWGGGGYYRRGWGGGGAVAAGIAGLAIGGLIGSALATPGYGYSYPAYGYSYPAYGYSYPAYPAYGYPAGYGYYPSGYAYPAYSYGGYPPSNAYRSYYSTSYGWGYGNAYWASSKQVRKAARKGRR